MEENQSHSDLAGDSQPDESKDDSTASSSVTSPPKGVYRKSTRLLADKKEPNSTNEADVSESESCCSVVSDVQATPRTRRRTAVREKPTVQEEASEVESCSSVASAIRSHRTPRSLRKRVLTSAATKESTKNDDDPSGAESCSSAVSVTTAMDTRRITRSHRKSAVFATEADSSEPDSCSSSVSGLCRSVVRRSNRIQKVKLTEPIPLSFEETSDTPSTVSKKRGRRCKTGVDEENESDGCKSGPSMSPWRSTRRQPKPGESDSESVATDVCNSQGSPSPQRGRGTPCSSRTGSASSTRAVLVSRTRSKAKVNSDVGDTTVAAMPEERSEELEPHPESIPVPNVDKAEDTVEQLDSTVVMDTSEAQECTMIEERAEDTTVVLDQDEPIEMQEPQSILQDVEVVEDSGTETLTLQEKPVVETSSTPTEEPGDIAMENKTEFVETSHVVENQTCSEPVKEDMVEAVAEDPKPAVVEEQTCSEPVEEDTIEIVAEDPKPAVVEEAIEDQTCSESVKEDEVETTLEDPVKTVVEEHENKVECEKKGVIIYEEANDTIKTTENDSVTLNDLEGPSTSSHTEPNLITTEETSKKPPPQKKMISLLDSSEDEDSADEGLTSEEEGCSQKAEDVRREDDVMCPDGNQTSAEAHGNRLFVIDTKPGQRSKKQYYVDAKQTEEQDEEDFVDEEGDDDDEDSKVLFTSKKPLYVLFSFLYWFLYIKKCFNILNSSIYIYMWCWNYI